MKRIFQLLAFTVIASMVVVACKDDFSEQDFINNQTTAKAKQDSIQAANLNSAGQLLSYTLQVLDDKTPVAGVAVVMSNPPAGTSTATLTATTDANGFATFKNVQIGANTFIISKTGYYPATFIVDFGSISTGTNYTTVNGTVVPIKRATSNQVPIFASAAGGATATVKGTVTIESDLTNTTPEVPQGLTIKANLATVTGTLGGNGGSTAAGSTNQATITTYYFNTGSIGTAAVDNTTGAYSMIVPAGADTRTLTMIYPTISTTQKVGYTKLNGATITPLISTTVPAVFGPSTQVGSVYTSDASGTIPAVPGATAVFSPAPAAPGAGLKITTSIIGRPLSTGIISNLGVVTTNGNETYQLTNKGSGYGASPSVTATGGGASTQATASASIAGVATGVNVTAGGTGYTGVVTLTLQQTDGVTSANAIDATSTAVSFTKDVGATPTSLTGLTFTLPATGAGFEVGKPFITSNAAIGFAVTGFKWVITNGTGTGATATASVSANVDKINIITGGTGYTSAPTFTIAAPSAGTTATLVVPSFASQYNVAYDNTANTTPYKVTPTAITFGYTALSGSSANTGATASLADQFATTSLALTVSTVSGGSVVFLDQSKAYKTNFFSTTAPVVVVTPSSSKPATASVTIDGTLGSATYGQVTAVTITDIGAGYDVAPTLTVTPVTGATGSGAKVDLSANITYSATTKVYTLSATPTPIVSNQGSGYVPYLNMYYLYYGLSSPGTAQNFSGATTVSVRTGDVILNDVKYGTGLKGINVN